MIQGILSWSGGRVVSLALVLASGWLMWFMRDSDTWRVHWVEVAGCSLTSPEAVVQSSDLAQAWAVGLVPEVIAARVETVPGILQAWVQVGWPNRVRIEVQEEIPVATVTMGDREYWVTETEELVEPFGRAEGLPRLTIINGEPASRRLTRQVLAGLVAMHQAFPNYAEYLYDVGKGFTITAERGYPVYLGDADDLEMKLTMLAALDGELSGEGYTPSYVDLSTVEGAVYE